MPSVVPLRVLCRNSHRGLINTSCCRFSTQRDTLFKQISRTNGARIAVLYQAIEPPIINGVRKPRKPGGYQDSGADIAYVLQQKKLDILTPSASPDPEDATGWCFPDTEDGIMTAVKKGATHIWANTILFASHPLQMSTNLAKYQDYLRVVSQPPNLVEKFDDKAYLNDLLRKQSYLTLPRAWTINMDQYQRSGLANIDPPFPLVAKPVRGRGSHGVKVCYNMDNLHQHLTSLFTESPTVLLEEFLSGEEATVTVMPPSKDRPAYWAMPVVVRFNHQEDIAPYNGITAVTENSRAISAEEAAHDPAYAEIQRQCETVARLLSVTAPIRIDVRRFKPDVKSKFALFDINMKPNMTGPGRPGRDNQASLTALAAACLGWDYPTLLSRILTTSRTLKDLRNMQPSIS